MKLLSIILIVLFYLLHLGLAIGILVFVFELLAKILGNLCDAIKS